MKQLTSIDAMLKAMFDWEPEAGHPIKADSTSYIQSGRPTQHVAEASASETASEDDGGGFISYTAEAYEWVKGCSGRVRVKDFAAWLESKYPPHMINRNSINQPFRKLTKDGTLILVRQGVGKMPSIFEVNPNPPHIDAS